jgi:hypothetical protein
MQHWYEQQARFEIDLYAGDARRGLARFRPMARELALVRRVRLHRVHILWLMGRILLAAADEGGDPATVAQAAGVARQLAREGVPFARTYALLLKAGVEYQRSEHAACKRSLQQAADLADTHDYPHCASAARLRLAAVVGGADGAALGARGREWMAEQSIRNPTRMAQLWAPGFRALG